MQELIKTLVGLNMQLLIGPGDFGHFEVRVTKLDEKGLAVKSHQQLLPVDNHSYEAKIVDCAQFCVNKLLTDNEE